MIPKGAPQSSFLTAHNRLLEDVQQPEPQVQQADAQPQDNQSDASDMEGSESDCSAESGYDSDEAENARRRYDFKRRKMPRDKIGPVLPGVAAMPSRFDLDRRPLNDV